MRSLQPVCCLSPLPPKHACSLINYPLFKEPNSLLAKVNDRRWREISQIAFSHYGTYEIPGAIARLITARLIANARSADVSLPLRDPGVLLSNLTLHPKSLACLAAVWKVVPTHFWISTRCITVATKVNY